MPETLPTGPGLGPVPMTLADLHARICDEANPGLNEIDGAPFDEPIVISNLVGVEDPLQLKHFYVLLDAARKAVMELDCAFHDLWGCQ